MSVTTWFWFASGAVLKGQMHIALDGDMSLMCLCIVSVYLRLLCTYLRDRVDIRAVTGVNVYLQCI